MKRSYDFYTLVSKLASKSALGKSSSTLFLNQILHPSSISTYEKSPCKTISRNFIILFLSLRVDLPPSETRLKVAIVGKGHKRGNVCALANSASSSISRRNSTISIYSLFRSTCFNVLVNVFSVVVRQINWLSSCCHKNYYMLNSIITIKSLLSNTNTGEKNGNPVQDINLAFSDRDLLLNIGFTLNENSRAALAGGNGCGKSTLLKVLNGDIQADSMEVSKTKGLRISYLPQSDIVLDNNTLFEEVEKSYSRFNPILKQKKKIENILAKSNEEENVEPHLVTLHEMQETLLEGGYFDRTITMEKILLGLGFSVNDFQRTCDEFSGGWQMRIALAKVL